MKDIHNHILFGIDDGSDNIEESIKMIDNAISNGYTDLILTPHYRVKQSYICNNKDKITYFKQLKEEVEKRGLKINLYLGNEITVDKLIFQHLENNQVMSLCNGRYILLELPFSSVLDELPLIIKRLRRYGYIPIIAHPERSLGYEIDDFVKMIKEGVLLQADSGSIYGEYGTKVQNRVEIMLKRHMIHFIGSDIHHDFGLNYDRIDKVLDKVKELTRSEKMAKELTDDNIQKVIDNREVEAYSICDIKYRLKIFNNCI